MKSSAISRFFFKKLSNFWVRAIFPEFRSFGELELSKNRGTLVIVYSETPLDILLVRSAFEGKLLFVVDDSCFKDSFFRHHFNSMPCISLKNEKLFDNILAALNAKEGVVFFLDKNANGQLSDFCEILSSFFKNDNEVKYNYLPVSIFGSSAAISKGMIPQFVPVKMISACPFVAPEKELNFDKVKSDLLILEKSIADLKEDEFPSIF